MKKLIPVAKDEPSSQQNKSSESSKPSKLNKFDVNGLVTPHELGLTPIRHERVAERVYDSLFHSIMSGRLPAKSRLPSEMQLAKAFDVSRPVVRQALDRLREDRLVESVRGSGTYVHVQSGQTQAVPLERTSTNLSHIFHGLELRMLVEPECAYLAALRRKPKDLDKMEEMLTGFETAAARGDVAHHFDYGFHEAIGQATANPRMAEVLKLLEYDVSHAVNMWRHLAHMKPWRRTQEALDEHRAIFEFITRQDADGARRAMRAHVENARIRMLEIDPEI